MDDLIKRAEEWLLLHSKHRQPTAEIITALLERVRELEEQLKAQQVCAGDWRKQAERAQAGYTRLEAALDQIIYEADEYKDSELVSIARKALRRI